MKLKRFLPICLLASSLLLTSCEDLLSNFLGGSSKKKNKDNETSQNYEDEQGYQGKQGATQLSQEEWDKAFSLKEFALRRNCHLDVNQDGSVMSFDVDNGKFSLEMMRGSQVFGNLFFKFDGVDANGLADMTVYSKDQTGEFQQTADQEPLSLVMAEFGILEYEYKNFTYNASTKQYTAASFTHVVIYMGQKALELNATDASIEIKDGFPSKVEFDFTTSGDDVETVHYIAEYSNYNRVNVTLPGSNGNNNNNNSNSSSSSSSSSSEASNALPVPDGEEISYAQFCNAFMYRPEATYNHAEFTISADGDNNMLGIDEGSYSGSATYNYGMWEVTGNLPGTLNMDDFILTEAALEQYNPIVLANYGNIQFFYNEMGNEYVAHAYYSVMGMDLSTNIYFDEYFYVKAEFIVLDDVYMAMEIEWSTINIPENQAINVANRSFVGVDVKEKDVANYAAYKEVAEATTINFDGEYCEMIIEKACSGNVVQDMYQVMVGEYEQNGNTVYANFTYYTDGNSDYQELPSSYSVNFTVDGGKILMPTTSMDESNQPITVTIVLEFSEPFDDVIIYPGSGNSNELDLTGTYTFHHFDYVLTDENNDEAKAEAQGIINQLEQTVIPTTMLVVDSSTQAFGYYESGYLYYGSYIFESTQSTIAVSFTMKIDMTSGQATDAQQISGSATYAYNQEKGYIYRVITSNDNYAVMAYYSIAQQ